MQIRSPRTLLAMSAALALTGAALAPTAAFAKGPGPGAGGCEADCTNDQAQVQQQFRAQDGTGGQAQTRTRARDASAQQTETRATAGGGQGVQARAGNGKAEPRGRYADAPKNQGGNTGAGRSPNDAALRGPEGCEECDIEMGTLTAEDEIGLVYMAQEEKLAHEVYVQFASMYDLPTFERIAMSEARHQAAIRTVLDRYGIADPTAALGEGVFIDTGLQQLYDALIAQGSLSLEDALAAAVLIEDTDIADLEEQIAVLGDAAPDVSNMYSHLLTASGYHKAAFERQL